MLALACALLAWPLWRSGRQWLAAALAACSVHAAERPNIVIVIADDLGWRDVGFHGAQVKTPNLDRLASGGAGLNAMYVQPYSSQTRAALLTGRYPMRYGLQSLSIGRNAAYGLPKEERTVAQALHEKGYRTAFVGDWRLGHAQPEFWPTRRGFETFYGSLAGSSESVVRKGAKTDWRRGEKPAVDAGYVTDLVAAETVAVIRKHDTSAPLFVVASFNAPAHYEDVPRELRESLKTVEDDTRRSYLAAVAGFDRALGAILAELERRQMSGSTLVVVLSDNGGAVPLRFATGDADVRRPAADNGTYREGKGSLYEGGVRAVAVASWPGRIPPGTVVTEPLHATDLGATVMALGDGQRLAAAFDAMIAGMAGEMERLGVRVTRLASAHAAPCFSFEGVFHWQDTWLPLHRSAPDPAHLARLTEPAANPEARALVKRLRDMTIDLFRQHGAASNQIGRGYPFLPVLRDAPAALLMAIKQALDPRNLMNPGVLGFPPPAG